jgi:type II secretory pathway predicted ATPase ExeA
MPPMLEQRFGLTRRPFPATPDSALYYPATPHEAALAPLLRALGDKEGLLLVTGDPGVGKTLLGQVLLERLGDDVQSALLTNSHLPDRVSLLQALLFDMGLPFEEGGEQILRLRLTDHLLKTCAAGKRTVVVIDEAHHLSTDLLEELRLLGNLEAGSDKAFQAVCLAQLSIVEALKQPLLASWKQRMTVHAHLAPLSVEEAYDYLLHHLRLAGAKPEKVIDASGMDVLARGTQGIPRLLNQAAHKALVLADTAEMDVVDAEAALEALAALGLEAEDAILAETPLAA